MNKFYVYMYLDSDNCPFYIGKGKGDRYYVSMHLGKNNCNRLLKNKIRKVGATNVRIHFLHKNLSEEEAFYWESYWIKYIGRRDLKEGSLCNLTDGGEGNSGRIVSDRTRQKMSGINKGRIVSTATRQKMSDSLRGRIISDEHKQKIRASNKGKKVSDETKQKISKSVKGRIVSDKTKQKISDSKKGEKNPMYGKSHTKGTKQKMREAAKGRTFSDATREKMCKAAKERIPWNKCKKTPKVTKYKI